MARYHGADADLTISTTAGTSITVGKIRQVEIIPQVEVDELYTADSILRADAKQRNASVAVSGVLVEWDTALVTQFLGGSGASSSSFVDTSDMALFDVDGKVDDETGTTKTAAVTEVFFPELEIFSTSHDAWYEKTITGTGKNVTFT